MKPLLFTIATLTGHVIRAYGPNYSVGCLQHTVPSSICAEHFVVINPLTPTVAIWVQLLKYPVPDRVKPSFVIFDICAF